MKANYLIVFKKQIIVGRILPPSTKSETGWNAAGATSNQPQTGCFEDWPYSKPAKYAD